MRQFYLHFDTELILDQTSFIDHSCITAVFIEVHETDTHGSSIYNFLELNTKMYTALKKIMDKISQMLKFNRRVQNLYLLAKVEWSERFENDAKI